jgi:hypothetical protein
MPLAFSVKRAAAYGITLSGRILGVTQVANDPHKKVPESFTHPGPRTQVRAPIWTRLISVRADFNFGRSSNHTFDQDQVSLQLNEFGSQLPDKGVARKHATVHELFEPYDQYICK